MRKNSIYAALRGSAKPGKGLVVIVRGPIGSGKSTLLRGLAGKPPWRFWYLDTDAQSGHPSDPSGEFQRRETPVEIDILGLHAKLTLGRGLNLALDQNFQTTVQVDRFLRSIGRNRGDPRVVMFRLTVDTDVAVRRRRTLRPSYVRASHRGFHLYPIPGELVVETTGLTSRQVLRSVRGALKDHLRRRRSDGPIFVRDVVPVISTVPSQ
ncbi:MAG: ATP-binding protein [Thermoplasmata archaeon]|nr:ATP-binding protein [Thermoplasmata archaeon]